MKRITFYLLITSVMALGLSCSSSVPMARVVIITGAQTTGRAEAPSNIISYTVTVSAADMATVSATFTVDPDYPQYNSSMSLSVPAGAGRTITVNANIDPYDYSSMLSWRGTVVANLAAGDNTIAVNMGTGNTKLIILEPCNNRLIQINDFNEPNWRIQTSNNISSLVGTSWRPWDFDFDNIGRLYVANNVSGNSQVVRINYLGSDMAGADDIVTTGDLNFTQCIAIDRTRNILYHSQGGDSLYAVDLSGDLPAEGDRLTVPSSAMDIRALAVDDTGMLYIADAVANLGDPGIVKIDPANPGVLLAENRENFDFSANLTMADICIYNNRVFVANQGGAQGYQVIELDRSLRFRAGYGPNPDAPGRLYGPHHFAAIRDDGIFFCDEGINPNNYLIRMDDMRGNGFLKFDNFPSDPSDSFEFFSSYYC